MTFEVILTHGAAERDEIPVAVVVRPQMQHDRVPYALRQYAESTLFVPVTSVRRDSIIPTTARLPVATPRSHRGNWWQVADFCHSAADLWIVAPRLMTYHLIQSKESS
ncbi:MAG: hypothetical protein ABIQ86_12070 [Steroidobacteraceae bacterium]